MHIILYFYPALLALLSLSSPSLAKNEPKGGVLLSEVTSLILRANAKTTYHRVPAIPQLTCNGPGCRYYKIDTMRCTNQGTKNVGKDTRWSCSARLPEGLELGSTDVDCEGYRNRDDPFVLRGSCGVTYKLLLTNAGEKKYQKEDILERGGSIRPGKGLSSYEWCFVVVFIVMMVALCYLPEVAPDEYQIQRRRRQLVRRRSPRPAAKHTSTGFGSTSRR